MIPRKNRFHGYGSLRFVYQRGQTVRGPMCAIKYVINDRRQEFRVAVVVSKKIHKSAVVRNRIRRRLYEVVRQQAPQINGAYDIVITVFSDQLTDLPIDDVRKMISSQFKQARVV